ncbi:hypothetical protein MMC17_001797 [Xylographa soralifera]|nr:hypothetical protein [Xylographa soralifera]
MVSRNSILMASAFALLSTVNGHMIMSSPTPYGKSSLNNSPLAADGSDFPCKQRSGVYDAEGASNTMPIGVNQTLSFTGSATHGGGSCQVSLTTDLNPTATSTWQVIYSILGGCPVNAAGNLPEDPNGSGATKFQFSIPEGINPGKYTLAWTWFNKVGNREMYMNCAPVTVTAAASKRDAIPEIEAAPLSKRANFPPMFVANACGHCSTPDDEDSVLMFPDPGQYVQYAGSSPFFSPTCACNAEAMNNSSSSAGAAPAPGAPASSATVSTLAASSAATPASSPSTAAGGAIASAIASAFPTTFSVVASAPVASSAPTGTSAPAAGSSSTSTTPSAGALTGPCTSEGEFNCIAGNSFQQCASGAWSVVQPMAPGTYCTAGQSSTLTISKRSSVRFSKEHIARHFARSGF